MGLLVVEVDLLQLRSLWKQVRLASEQAVQASVRTGTARTEGTNREVQHRTETVAGSRAAQTDPVVVAADRTVLQVHLGTDLVCTQDTAGTSVVAVGKTPGRVGIGLAGRLVLLGIVLVGLPSSTRGRRLEGQWVGVPRKLLPPPLL